MLRKLMLLILGLATSITSFADGEKIRFAMEATYPPFESVNPSGEIVGFDIDIAKAICENIKAECSFENEPWDSLIPGLKFGKFDAIISALAVTAAREKQVSFSEPYYLGTASFIAAENKKLDISPRALKGKTVGVQGGTSMENYMRGFYKDEVNVKTYASINDAFLDLRSTRIDAVVADTPIANDWVSLPQGSGFVIVGKPIQNPKYFGSGIAIAVNKNNTDLLEQLNKGISNIKSNGTYDKILTKYFGKNM